MTTCEIGVQFNHSQQLPFVLYAKPNSDKMVALLQNNSRIYRPSSENSGFVFAPFEGKESILIADKHATVLVETVNPLQNLKEYFPDVTYSDKDKKAFETKVSKAVQAIKNDEFEKVVVSRKELVKIGGMAPYQLFQKLKATYSDAFCYVFYHPKVGVWAGATPEQFLKKSDLTLETVSLAGTQLYDENGTVWNQKEIEEQQIVTDYIQKSLDENCTNLTISEAFTQKAGNLVHLKSIIKGELHSESAFVKVIQKLHPTPAVCGVPKDKALKFIAAHEGYERTFYTGYLGEWMKDYEWNTEKTSDLFVNLRCMKVSENEATLFIGCGITKDSNPEKEFLETVNKSQTMKRILKD